MDSTGQQIQPGRKKPRIGSREGFDRLWARYRAQIQSEHDHVMYKKRGLHVLAEGALNKQVRMMAELEKSTEAAWQGQLGEIWRWLGKIDPGLLEKQLADLALIQADDLREGSGKWQAVEGVIGLLGELGDLLRKLEANNGHGR